MTPAAAQKKFQSCAILAKYLTRSDSKLGLVGVDLLEELHGDLVLLHLCPSHTLEVELLLLHIDHWVLQISHTEILPISYIFFVS